MGQLKNIFLKYAELIDDKWDDLSYNLTRKLGLNHPVQIVPYRTYGTAHHIYIKGRVLEDKKIATATDKDTIWHNLLNMYKRFESDEVPNACIKITLLQEEHKVYTDKEGYFVLDIKPIEAIINEKLWHPIQLTLLDAPITFEKDLTTWAEIMIPPPDAEYGIISDIDDTIVETNATSLLAMSRITFLNNARTRLPFAGVAEFYRSLQLGRNGKRNNPFFYVSSSPWNLYDLLKDFMDLNNIPEGPILLRDFGLNREMAHGHLSHKMKEIIQVIEAYPHLNFVLIGDSGQEDPLIYQEVVKKYPGRILAIYIRDVQLPERKKIAKNISDMLAQDNIEMVIVENTVQAAEHAAQKGLIFNQAIKDIEVDKQEDKGEKPGKEEL